MVYDTIAAVATPPGEGGVGIIRLSGPESLKIAKKLFKTPGKVGEFEERRLYYGRFTDGPGGTVIDDGLLVFMKGPRSFTGEDVVEFNCHGGSLLLKALLTAIFKEGARAAGPGEFTRRAFCNGKLDLTQAEAVVDIIRAGTTPALLSARGRLDGALSGRINDIKELLVTRLTHLEAELDFSEEEVEPMGEEELLGGVLEAEEAIEGLLCSFDEGRALREGVRVLILGRPNAGKSSLLNLLLKEERAIVTPHVGTTRDVIEEAVNIRGLPVRLMDTAGLRDTADEVEALGIKLARGRIEEAELILFVVDSTAPDGFSEDKKLIETFGEKKLIVVLNKTDLACEGAPDKVSEIGKEIKGASIVRLSAVTGEGLSSLEEKIYEEGSGRSPGAGRGSLDAPNAAIGEMIVSARQKAALDGALTALQAVRSTIDEGLTRDITAGELRLALDRLGEITGETTTDDILDRIFSDFCIGK